MGLARCVARAADFVCLANEREGEIRLGFDSTLNKNAAKLVLLVISTTERAPLVVPFLFCLILSLPCHPPARSTTIGAAF